MYVNAFTFPILLCSVKLLAPTRLFTMRREENKTLLPIANNVQLLVCEIITEIAPWIKDKKTAVCGHVTSSEVSFCSVVCAFSQFQVYLLDSSLCLLFWANKNKIRNETFIEHLTFQGYIFQPQACNEQFFIFLKWRCIKLLNSYNFLMLVPKLTAKECVVSSITNVDRITYRWVSLVTPFLFRVSFLSKFKRIGLCFA